MSDAEELESGVGRADGGRTSGARMPERARIRKLEERNEVLRGTLEAVAEDLEEAVEVGVIPRAQVKDALNRLEPFRLEDG